MCQLTPIIEKVAFVGKKSLLYFGQFGLIAWLVGTVTIDRQNSKEARETLNKKMEEVLRQKVDHMGNITSFLYEVFLLSPINIIFTIGLICIGL